jgi:predicted RNase H-like HicB family nuclease
MVSALGAQPRTGYCRFYRHNLGFQQGGDTKVALFLYRTGSRVFRGWFAPEREDCVPRNPGFEPDLRLKWVIPFYTLSMRNEFTAVIERDNDWYVAWSPEIPGANGQGRSVEECRASLGAAIQLILEDRREDGLRGAPADALRETVTIQ